jgi:hypothetical protein
MRLRDLRHSTSFRLGLIFAGFFGAALLLLFSFVYWWTRDYVVREVDAWLVRETAGRAVLAPAEVERTLNARAMVQPDDLHPIALFNSNSDWLAGSRVSLPQGAPPFDQPFRFTGSKAARPRCSAGLCTGCRQERPCWSLRTCAVRKVSAKPCSAPCCRARQQLSSSVWPAR